MLKSLNISTIIKKIDFEDFEAYFLGINTQSNEIKLKKVINNYLKSSIDMCRKVA